MRGHRCDIQQESRTKLAVDGLAVRQIVGDEMSIEN